MRTRTGQQAQGGRKLSVGGGKRTNAAKACERSQVVRDRLRRSVAGHPCGSPQRESKDAGPNEYDQSERSPEIALNCDASFRSAQTSRRQRCVRPNGTRRSNDWIDTFEESTWDRLVSSHRADAERNNADRFTRTAFCLQLRQRPSKRCF